MVKLKKKLFFYEKLLNVVILNVYSMAYRVKNKNFK